MESDNLYAYLEGYKVYDSSGEEVGEIDQAVYDAPADVLKYVIVDGHTVPAERIEVDAENESVRVPYSREKVQSAPKLDDASGEFEDSLREHYEETN